MKIKIMTPYGRLKANIEKTKNPKTVKALIKVLPVIGEANIWGEEIYFKIPIKVGKENSQQEVEIGELAYWPAGESMCIFFGRTPVSTSDKPRAYSPVNVFGRLTGNVGAYITMLSKVKNGDKIKVEAE